MEDDIRLALYVLGFLAVAFLIAGVVLVCVGGDVMSMGIAFLVVSVIGAFVCTLIVWATSK
jgi:hypothetical protein